MKELRTDRESATENQEWLNGISTGEIWSAQEIKNHINVVELEAQSHSSQG